MQVSIEKIINLKPDLVLATALTRQDQIKQLQDLGLRVVRFGQPASFAELCAQFLKLGELLGLTERAQRIVDQAQAEVDDLQRRVNSLPPQKALLQVGARALFVAVPGSFTYDFIALANGINIAAGQEKKKWQRFPVLRAVRTGRVHVIDPDLVCSPSPATFARTLRIIAGLIHPEIAPHEDMMP